MTLDEIKAAIQRGDYEDGGIAVLSEYIQAHPDDDEALTARGLRHWSCGDRAAAIKDYLAALRINPDSKAKMALKATNEILDYYNKDLYNP
ncbi:MAG: hypothetical protein K2O24_00045 [Muribaculaceae bacterium]|nr:hypothetical protein [Muribaculaceae bacterium]